MTHIVLDSAPLGPLSSPGSNADVVSVGQWSRDCVAAGHSIYVQEIVDYELRRELIWARKTNSLVKLDNLRSIFDFVPITSNAMLRAADLWAFARQSGMPAADPKRLDVDVILCAQALTLPVPVAAIVVATSNAGHISRFIAADVWTNIKP